MRIVVCGQTKTTVKDNYQKFMDVINYIRDHKQGFVGFTREFQEDRTLYQSFLEKLLDNGMIESSNQSKWHVRAKQALIEISDKKLKKIYLGVSIEKPKWKTFDFYMEEGIKYLIGAALGIAITLLIFWLSRRKEVQTERPPQHQVYMPIHDGEVPAENHFLL